MSKRGPFGVLIVAQFLLSAQETHPRKSDPVISAQRKDILIGFESAAGEAVALAKAVPEDKYAWRPMDGVRSFGEVFVHMGGSTLLFSSYAGLEQPRGAAYDLATIYMKRGFEMPEIFAAEAAIKDKSKVLAIMGQSFQLARDLIRNMPDADLEKSVQFFGRSMTMRAL